MQPKSMLSGKLEVLGNSNTFIAMATTDFAHERQRYGLNGGFSLRGDRLQRRETSALSCIPVTKRGLLLVVSTILYLLLTPGEAFASPQTRSGRRNAASVVLTTVNQPFKAPYHDSTGGRRSSVYMSLGDSTKEVPPRESALTVAGYCSAVVWIALSVVALSYHPDPRFASCSIKHNVLTMSQAFGFPLGVLWSAFSGAHECPPLRLGIAMSTAFLAASTVWAPRFAFGYDLYSMPLKILSGSVFGITSLLALTSWRKSRPHREGSILTVLRQSNKALWSLCSSRNETAALYASATIGLLWFTLLPIVSPYPLATVPTILGKRLSRPASAFTFLGAVEACILKQAADKSELETPLAKILRQGLGWGSAMHVGLIALKLIGVDDGGFLIPGRGLWEVYPAMLAVPFATATSILVHVCVCIAAFS